VTQNAQRWLVMALVVASTGGVLAQSQADQKTPSTFDRVWKFAEWYNDSSNPVVQRIQFSGRYQHEFAALDADQGDHSEWNVRRFRLGPRVTFLRSFLFHAEADLNPQETDPLFIRMTDLYVQWTKSPRLAITVGKHAVNFTMDGSTSSKELIAIDRSNLTNNIWFTEEYLPGVGVSGRVAPWSYRAGLYSSGSRNKWFGEGDGGLFTYTLLSYDFGRALGVREATLAGNYLYQQPDAKNTFTRPFENIFSANFKVESERWGVRSDLSAASGYLGQSDVWGAMTMPYWSLTPRFQVVGRYTYVTSDNPNGVRFATYESAIVSGRGDRYNEVYGGANYFFHGHKLKLQTGIQYADMNDRANDGGAYSGTSWVTGVRIGWP
jgi:phosphate-selective porin OprO and OprP